ncbi:ABC transporter permease [Ornithinibacillus contaminans]|uniref:ABC transporter permease n=1 Tax=Ornithinibacillus contaminans TaxID=694055 RepID=UPI00064DC7D2|nr:FtsX-like permease family protein [Ornithinibacillus contaminans]
MKKLTLHGWRNITLLITVLILVISTVTYSFSKTYEANEKVEQNITNFSRGTYDILIRPPDARTTLESQLDIVEENYLGVGNGGITIDEWETIKNHPNVEIAAPVASIGLFKARDRTWMIEKDANSAQYYEVQYITNDGYKTYPNKDNSFVFDFTDTIFPSSLEVVENYVGFDIASFTFPDTFHQVVAIDPVEEGKLTNYDFSPLTEQIIDYEAYLDGKLSTPIMSLKDATVPVSIRLTIDDLEQITEEEILSIEEVSIEGNPLRTMEENKEAYNEIVESYIQPKRAHKEKVYDLELEESHSPFSQDFLYVSENKLHLGKPDGAWGGAFNFHAQRIGYQLDPVTYKINKQDQSLFVEQIATDEIYDSPVYRQMNEITIYDIDESGNPINDEDYFGFVLNGTFSIKENVDTLASSPLGIYGSKAPHLATDPSITVHPSAVPGSYITTPAHGLIALDWAEKIKGKAPIDAIRVKVSGLNGYDEEAANKIENLASEWEKEGYTIDIVAGASLQEVLVDVEGIGEILQPFTTLGAAGTIVESWNSLQLLITLLYCLIAFIFIAFVFYNLLQDREREETLLDHLGWAQKDIRKLRYKEWKWILGIPIMVTNSIFFLNGYFTSSWLSLYISSLISIVTFILFLGIQKLSSRKKQKRHLNGKTMITENIGFYYHQIIAACVQIFLVTLLTCFLPFFLIQHVGVVTQTRLGTYIHGDINGIFIIIISLLYLMSFLTIYQTLARLWQKRAGEIHLFHVVGWGNNHVRTYFLKEVLLWSGLSSIIGWLISLLFIVIFVDLSVQSAIHGILACIAIVLVTVVIAVLSINRYFNKGGKSHVHPTT